jgi:hypothetical protein
MNKFLGGILLATLLAGSVEARIGETIRQATMRYRGAGAAPSTEFNIEDQVFITIKALPVAKFDPNNRIHWIEYRALPQNRRSFTEAEIATFKNANPNQFLSVNAKSNTVTICTQDWKDAERTKQQSVQSRF